MKRRAILFYNDDGELKTKKDIDDMVSFLVSPTGGCWDDGREIMCRKNVEVIAKPHFRVVREPSRTA